MATYYKWDRSNPQMELYKKQEKDSFLAVSATVDPYDIGRAYYVAGPEVVLKAGKNGGNGQIQITGGTSSSMNWNTMSRSFQGTTYVAFSTSSLTANSLLDSVYRSSKDNVYLVALTQNSGTDSETTVTVKISAQSNEGDTVIQYGCRYTGPGETIDSVYSLESTTYPVNTYQDGYYYVRSTVTSPTVPTSFQCPATIIVPQVTISWNAATSNVPDYPIKLYEVSCATNNGSTYEVLGTTENTTYTYNLPDNVTSVRFRVRAQDTNDQWGNYTYGSWCTYISIPTITVSESVFVTQPISIEWNGEGADSYQLQRKTNLDSDWQDLYNGTDLSYTDTCGTWLNVQYRVRAIVGDAQGEWGTSSVILCYDSEKIIQMNYKNSNNTYSLLYPQSKEAVVMGWKKFAEVPITTSLASNTSVPLPNIDLKKGYCQLPSGFVFVLNVDKIATDKSTSNCYLDVRISNVYVGRFNMYFPKANQGFFKYKQIIRVFAYPYDTNGTSQGRDYPEMYYLSNENNTIDVSKLSIINYLYLFPQLLSSNLTELDATLECYYF